MDLVRSKRMSQEDEDLYQETDSWFAENLPWVPRCSRKESVICFFKTENSDEMLKMIRPAFWLLEKYDVPYYIVYTNSPGEIVYENKYQIAAKVPEELMLFEKKLRGA